MKTSSWASSGLKVESTHRSPSKGEGTATNNIVKEKRVSQFQSVDTGISWKGINNTHIDLTFTWAE